MCINDNLDLDKIFTPAAVQAFEHNLDISKPDKMPDEKFDIKKSFGRIPVVSPEIKVCEDIRESIRRVKTKCGSVEEILISKQFFQANWPDIDIDEPREPETSIMKLEGIPVKFDDTLSPTILYKVIGRGFAVIGVAGFED